MYVCLCRGVTEAQFQSIVLHLCGACEGIKQEMGLDESCCGRCEAQLEEIIQQVSASG
jgi:bacterioferritin-associated ferredoxin